MTKKKTFKIQDTNEWEGADMQTDSVPLANDGSGKPIILRTFDFDLPPLEKENFPTKQQLLDFHYSKIIAFLWRDELVPCQKLKLMFSKDKKHFRIFATCQAKVGSNILEVPELIQNKLNG